MKAAVLHHYGEIPKYEDFKDPIVQDGQELMTVKAASIKNIDKMIAKVSHYHSTSTNFPIIPGVDGVGILENGTRVYSGALNQFGMMAEKTIFRKGYGVPIPNGLDDITAAAIPNPAVSAWLSLEWRGKLNKGDTVFILGATGITGKMAVQLAAQMGAGKIVAVGRNENALQELTNLGATKTVRIADDKELLNKLFLETVKESPVDIVLDYLWGSPAEILLGALSGSDLNAAAHTTRYVQIGEMAGPSINLPGAVLRSASIELYGSGGGSIPKDIMGRLFKEVVPNIFNLAASGRLKIETEAVSLKDIENVWEKKDNGKRLVVVP